MVRASVVRLSVGVVGAVLMLTTGCNCQPAVDECKNVQVTFASPVDGATVNPTLDVEVRANNNGTGLAIDSATIAVKAPGAADFGAEQDTTVSTIKALLTGLALTPGQSSIRATVKTKDPACSGKQATITVTARATMVAAKVTKVSFPQDLNGDGVLNGVELPSGTNLIMSVTATDTDSTTVVRALSGTSAVSVADATFSGGVAMVEIPVLSNSGTFDLFAQLAAGGTAINTTTGNPEGLGSIRVNRTAPTCAITNADVLGPTDDVTGSAATFGLRATGTVGSTAVSSTFGIDAATPVAVVATGGVVSTDFAVSKMGDNTYTLKLSATDAVGNICTASKLVRVDLAGPTVTLAVAGNTDGGVAQITSTPVDVVITAVGGADGNAVCLYRQQGTTPRALVSCGVLASGTATIQAAFSADGDYTLTAEVTDSAKNVGSASIPVHVFLASCGLTFATIGGKAAQCPAFVTQLNAGQYAVTLATSTACTGGTISLYQDDVLVSTSTTGSFNVPTTQGTHILRGEIPNGVGEANTKVSCSVEVNTTAFPVFTNPAANFGQVVLNAAADTQPGTPGAQAPLAFSATVPNMGRVELCANTNNAAIVGANAAACSDGSSGWFVYQGKTNLTSPIAAFTFAEGTYLARLVVVSVGGVALADTLDLSLFVDVTAPCVTSSGLTLPQDANADGKLNAAELGSAAPQVAFSIDPACGDVSTEQIKSSTTATTYSTAIAPTTGVQTTDLTGVASTASLDVFVLLRDAAGNTTTASTSTGRKAFLVDRDVPTCTVVKPNKTSLNISDVPSGSLAVQIQTSSDVGSVPVTLGVASATPNVDAPTFVASTSFALTGTGTQTIGATCTDPAGNSATATASIAYDLDPPTCAFTAPAAGSSSTSNDLTVSLAIGGADGQAVRILSSAQASDVGSLTVASGVATGTVTGFPNGLAQTLTGIVSDVAGNTCTATVANVNIVSTNCNLTTNGYANGTTLWVNTALATGTGSTRTADIVATSSNCITGQTVTLTRTAPTAANLGTQTTNSSGVATFSAVSLSDGDVINVAIDNGTGIMTNRTLTVDFTAPTVASVTFGGVAAPATDLFFVAPGTGANAQNRQVQLGTAGYFPDTDATTAGAQFALAVNTITGGTQGGAPGSLNVKFKGSPILSATSLTASPQSVTGLAASLPHNDAGAFVITVMDQAGNSVDVYSQNATIDVIAPAKPANVVRALVSAREASASIAWDPVGDDGATGTVKDYDVRWTTLSVNGNNKMAAETDYFGSSSVRESASPASATRITRTLSLPALNTYYLAVRARDEVDNYSPFEAPPTAGIDNTWTQLVFAGNGTDSVGSLVVADSSLNNDAINDLVIAASSTAETGAAYVIYGGATFGGQTLTAAGCVSPACTRITPPVTTPANTTEVGFANDLSMGGNIGDEVTGTNPKNDLVVSEVGFPDNSGTQPGRVLIYFGGTTATLNTAQFVEIRGTATSRIGSVAKIIKDINADGIDDLIIAAPFYSPSGSPSLGRVYIFTGRTISAWLAAENVTDASTSAKYLSIDSADFIIDGTTTPSAFGRQRFGITSLGDLNGDGKSEFTVAVGSDKINKLNLYTPGVGTAAPTILQTLTHTVPTSPQTSFATGFGGATLGGYNLLNGSGNDLVVAYQANNNNQNGQVFIYADLGASGAPTTPSLTITGGLFFGSEVSAGNVNSGDTNPDLLVGSSSPGSSFAYLLWNHGGTFATTIDQTTPQFWISRWDGNAISGETALNRIGNYNAISDLTGGGADVVLSDPGNHIVYVWK